MGEKFTNNEEYVSCKRAPLPDSSLNFEIPTWGAIKVNCGGGIPKEKSNPINKFFIVTFLYTRTKNLRETLSYAFE